MVSLFLLECSLWFCDLVLIFTGLNMNPKLRVANAGQLLKFLLTSQFFPLSRPSGVSPAQPKTPGGFLGTFWDIKIDCVLLSYFFSIDSSSVIRDKERESLYNFVTP